MFEIRLRPKKHPPYLSALFPIMNVFMYNVIFESLQNNTETLASMYGYQQHLYDIVMLSEVAVSSGVVAVVNVFLREYAIQRCFSYGCLIWFFSSLFSIPALKTHISVFFIFRFIAGVGFGSSLTTGVAMVNYYTKWNPELGICFLNFISPLGNVVAFIIFQYGSGDTIFYSLLGISLLGVAEAILIFFAIKPDVDAQIEHFSIANMVFMQVSHFIFGISGSVLYATKNFFNKEQMWIAISVEIVGILLIITSYMTNYYCKSFRIIPCESFNRNTVKYHTQYTLIFIIRELVFQDYNEHGVYQELNHYNAWLTQIKFICSLILLPVYSAILKRFTIRELVVWTTFSMQISLVLNLLNLSIIKSSIIYCFLNIAINGLVIGNQTVCQYYNGKHSYIPLSTTCGSYLYHAQKIAYVIAYCLQFYIEKIQITFEQKQILVYLLSIACLHIGQCLVRDIGIFPFEEGRIGYKKCREFDCKTFPQLLEQHSREQQKAFQQNERGMLLCSSNQAHSNM